MAPRKWWFVLMMQTIFTMPPFFIMHSYAVKVLIDVIVQNEVLQVSRFYFPAFLYIGTEIYLSFIWRLSGFAALHCYPQTSNAILLKTYRYVQNHSYKYFVEKAGGSITSKIKGIVQGFDTFMSGVQYRVGGPFMAGILSIVAIGFINIPFALFLTVWAVAFMFIMVKLSRKMESLSFAESESRHILNGRIADTITNIFTLFSFSARTYEYKHLASHIENDLLPRQKKAIKFDILFQITGASLYILLLSACIASVIYLKYRGSISMGDIYFVLSLTQGFIENCWRITSESQYILKNIGDLKSSFSIIATPNDADSLEDKKLNVNVPSICFSDIAFSHSKKAVFENLSFFIKPGEKVGIVGRSGAGKSTLVNLLLRYISPSHGKIEIDGKNIYEFSRDSLRESIAIIPQDIILFNRTLRDNIKYGKTNATDEEMHEACKKANIHDFILELELGYDTLVGERGIKLSGGQRQRIGIARAILKNAKILILDEATSSLDSESEKFVQESINVLLENNMTIIAIAHRLATLKHMDRILVLEKGKIIEEGKHDDLLQNHESLYKLLWDMQKI